MDRFTKVCTAFAHAKPAQAEQSAPLFVFEDPPHMFQNQTQAQIVQV